jgi:hypothetical protein
LKSSGTMFMNLSPILIALWVLCPCSSHSLALLLVVCVYEEMAGEFYVFPYWSISGAENEKGGKS